jgi:hypothetical protein
MSLMLSPECLPFAIAAAMLAGLTALEILAMLIGFSLSSLIGKPEIDSHDGLLGLVSWLNVGRVPVLVLLMLLFGIFAIAGFVIQALCAALWAPLPALVASVPAAVITLPAVRSSSRAIARIVPRDETYAVELGEFIGRTAMVTIGPLDQGLPGRVRVKDPHGNWHDLRAGAARGEPPLPVGSAVLLVDRKADVFTAISAPPDVIASGGQSLTEQS